MRASFDWVWKCIGKYIELEMGKEERQSAAVYISIAGT